MPAAAVLLTSNAEAFLSFFGLLVAVGVATMTYNDAKDNSPDPAWIWALLVFVIPILVLYYLVRGRER